ncbi:hypothetical protein ACGF0D_32025 [Kitasatospora sp. NPDC048298]|uniref:hypothetical protein n=1 Tax=Kitasatospora sp. NPDC048298 TaxID=3364049 RepID=UPI00371F9BB2
MGLNSVRIVFALLEASRGGPPTGSVEPAGPVVEDLIWAHARPSEGLEHLTVRLTAEGMELYFFVRSDSEAAAFDTVRTLLERVREPLSRHGLALIHQ